MSKLFCAVLGGALEVIFLICCAVTRLNLAVGVPGWLTALPVGGIGASLVKLDRIRREQP